MWACRRCRFIAESVADALTQCVIESVHLLPGFVKLETGADDLKAEMVFLVDHNGGGFGFADGYTAVTVSVGMFPADELAFHQKLAVELRELVNREVGELPDGIKLLDTFAEQAFDLASL
jgi:hypothetical protein